MLSQVFLTHLGIRERENKEWNQEKGETKTPPLSNYATTSSRSGKEVADLEELSVTSDPLAGGDNDKLQ